MPLASWPRRRVLPEMKDPAGGSRESGGKMNARSLVMPYKIFVVQRAYSEHSISKCLRRLMRSLEQ